MNRFHVPHLFVFCLISFSYALTQVDSKGHLHSESSLPFGSLGDDEVANGGHLREAVAGLGTDYFGDETETGSSPYAPASSCMELKSLGKSSGTYFIRGGPTGSVRMHCDMDYDGGGWGLITQVAYVSRSELRLVPRLDTYLPMNKDLYLGNSTEYSNYDGYIARETLNSLAFSEMRFYCTSTNNKVVNFKTKDTSCLCFLKSQTATSCASLTYTLYGDHTAINIPQGATASATVEGNDPLFFHNFYKPSVAHFHFGSISGVNQRFECDDYAFTSQNTIHKIWVR